MHCSESKKDPRLLRAIARNCEKGFTLMEILVALAIIAIIIAVTANVLGGRATDTRLESIASGVAQSVQSTQQLFINDLRQAEVTEEELAGRLSSALTPLSEVTSVSATSGTACDTGSAGVSIVMTTGVPGALDAAEQAALQALINTGINNIFDGIAATDPGGFEDVFEDAASGQTVLGTPEDAGTPANNVHICLN